MPLVFFPLIPPCSRVCIFHSSHPFAPSRDAPSLLIERPAFFRLLTNRATGDRAAQYKGPKGVKIGYVGLELETVLGLLRVQDAADLHPLRSLVLRGTIPGGAMVRRRKKAGRSMRRKGGHERERNDVRNGTYKLSNRAG